MIGLQSGQIAEAVGGKLYGATDVTVTSVSTDSRKTGASDLFVALRGERFDGNDYLHDIDGRVGAAISERFEEVSYPLIVVEDSLEAMTVLSKYYAENIASTKINLSLTGSVGKTTTKEMVAAVLSTSYNTAYTKGNFNNHIGVPLTLLSVEKEHEALVCEMGMNHKGELAHLTSLVSSDIAIITNIGHSHIENLGSREGIRDAKLEILGGLKKDGILILNGDEPLLEKVDYEGRVIRVGFGDGCDLRAEDIEMGESEVRYTLHAFGRTAPIRLSCTGRHNVINSLFAISAGLVSEISLEKIQEGLLNYRSVGLRQNIYIKDGIKVIADCYNAGIESMTAALQMLSELSCDGKRIAVLADMLELGAISDEAHTGVGEKAAECGIDLVMTYGKAAKLISKAASSDKTATQHFETKEELAKALREALGAGDTVLFKGSHSMKLEEVIALAEL